MFRQIISFVLLLCWKRSFFRSRRFSLLCNAHRCVGDLSVIFRSRFHSEKVFMVSLSGKVGSCGSFVLCKLHVVFTETRSCTNRKWWINFKTEFQKSEKLKKVESVENSNRRKRVNNWILSRIDCWIQKENRSFVGGSLCKIMKRWMEN